MRFVLGLMFIATVSATPAAAQTVSRAEAARTFVRVCSSSTDMRRLGDPRAACACMLGHYAVSMEDRQVVLLSRLFQFFAEGASLDVATQALVNEGYASADITAIADIVRGVGGNMGQTCGEL